MPIRFYEINNWISKMTLQRWTENLQQPQHDVVTPEYDNDQDYDKPYHWYLEPDDLIHGGMD